jgi:hypothetical protein
MEIKMQKRLSISFELREDRGYDSLVLRLRHHDAVPVLPTQWILLTSLTVDEIRRDLQTYIDPADRLLVTQVASMSSRNLIDNDKFGTGTA